MEFIVTVLVVVGLVLLVWLVLERHHRATPRGTGAQTSATGARDGSIAADTVTHALAEHVLQDPSWPDIEVVGEQCRRESFQQLFEQEGTRAGGVLARTGHLVPEPTNPYDPNAVMVVVAGHHLGYLPREIAVLVSPAIRQAYADGLQPVVAIRIWARNDHGTWRARVTLGLSGRVEDERDFAEEEAERRRREQMWQETRIAGAVRGIHFTGHRDEVAKIKRDGDLGGALQLLMECVGAAERVAKLEGRSPDVWPTEQAAIVLRKLKDFDGEVAVLERYVAAYPAGQVNPRIAARLPKAYELSRRPEQEADTSDTPPRPQG